MALTSSPRPVGERIDRSEWLGGAFHEAEHVQQLEEVPAGIRRRWR